MTNTLDRIQTLVARNEVRVSLHGSEELAADDVQVRDVIAGVATAVMVEDYPNYPKGRCCLVLQRDAANRPVHVVWGIPSGRESVRSIMKFVRGGAFAAEVNVEILEEERSWAPYLSLEDAYKLDDVRDALRAGDIDRASRLAERVSHATSSTQLNQRGSPERSGCR